VLAHPPLYHSMERLEQLAREQRIHGVEARHPAISPEEEQQIDDWMDGDSITNRRNWT